MHHRRIHVRRAMVGLELQPDESGPGGGGRPGLPGGPINPQALERLRELDPDDRMGVLTRVLTAYRGSLGRHLDELGSAQACGDGKRLLRVVHTLKSSSAAVGADQLSARCAALEEACRELTGPWPEPGVEALIHEGRAVLAAVEAMLSR